MIDNHENIKDFILNFSRMLGIKQALALF